MWFHCTPWHEVKPVLPSCVNESAANSSRSENWVPCGHCSVSLKSLLVRVPVKWSPFSCSAHKLRSVGVSWMLLGDGKPPKCPEAPEPLLGSSPGGWSTRISRALPDGKGLLQSACGCVPGSTCTSVQSGLPLILTFSFINIIEDADNFIKPGFPPNV